MRPFLALLLLLAFPARAVIIDGPDGSLNTTPPPDDPGFAHVGNKQGLTAVYIGKSYVLSANHVPIGPVTLGAVTYDYVRDSKTQLQPEGSATNPPDLAIFRIYPEPPLPDLSIRADPLTGGEPVVMIGNGRNRGNPTTWNPPMHTPIDGYEWGVGKAIRWGTNVVDALVPGLVIGGTETDSFSTEFTESVGPDECQAANGDSGGAAFVKNGGTWELAGIMFAIATFTINGEPQPANTALYGNLSYSADLSVYRDQILAIRDAPTIPALPAWGIALLAGLVGGAGAAACCSRRRP